MLKFKGLFFISSVFELKKAIISKRLKASIQNKFLFFPKSAQFIHLGHLSLVLHGRFALYWENNMDFIQSQIAVALSACLSVHIKAHPKLALNMHMVEQYRML